MSEAPPRFLAARRIARGPHAACRLASLLLSALLLGACAGDDAEQPAPGVTAEEILLGTSSPLSGHAGFLGTEYSRGSEALFREVNASGGIHGRKIRVVQLDDRYDPDTTWANTESLIHEHRVFMLFNHVGTPTSMRILPLIESTGIPALGLLTGAEPLRTPFQPSIFHVRASYFAEAEGAVAHFVDELGLKRVAVMYQDDAFGLAVLQGAQLAMGRRGLEIHATDTHERGQQDVERAVETLQASDAEAVVMVGTYGALARFVKLGEDAGFHPHYHTVSFVGSTAFAQELTAVQGVATEAFERILVTQVVPSPESQGLDAVDSYRRLTAKYFPEHEPNYVALEGFINARVLVEALEQVGPELTWSSLVGVLENLEALDVGIGKALTYGGLDRKGLSDVYLSRLTPQGTFETFER